MHRNSHCHPSECTSRFSADSGFWEKHSDESACTSSSSSRPWNKDFSPSARSRNCPSATTIFFANNFVGSLTKKANSYARGFEAFTDTLSFNIITNVFPIIFATVILWRYSPVIPLILYVAIAVAAAAGIPIIRRRSRLVSERHAAGSKLAGRLSDSITNMLAIKSFAKERNELLTYSEFVADYAAKFKTAANYQNLRFDMVMSPLYVVTNMIGLIAAIYFTQKLGLQAGAMVVVFSYYSQISRIFWDINRIYRNLESSISEATEFAELILEPPAVRDGRGRGRSLHF